MTGKYFFNVIGVYGLKSEGSLWTGWMKATLCESGDHLEKTVQLSQTFLTQYSTFKTSFTRNAFMTQVYIIGIFGIWGFI